MHHLGLLPLAAPPEPAPPAGLEQPKQPGLRALVPRAPHGGATLLDAPARFLAYTRGVAGVFEKPSTAQFEANTTSVRPKPARGGTAGRAEVREASGAKNVRRWPVLYVNPPAGEAS